MLALLRSEKHYLFVAASAVLMVISGTQVLFRHRDPFKPKQSPSPCRLAVSTPARVPPSPNQDINSIHYF
jgi:hypothetical protein